MPKSKSAYSVPTKKEKSDNSKNIILNESKTLAPGEIAIKSPMSGIFYKRQSPNSPDFVDENKEISKDSVLGLLEVMKKFYPIYSGYEKKLLIK